MHWAVHNPNSAVWTLEGSRFQVWAPQDARTFTVRRFNSLGNPVTIKRGFRKLLSAQVYAEHCAAKESA